MQNEILGTYFLIFAGCGSVVVNADKGHISGAHFNPAVTIAFATCKRFPWKQVPAYVAAQDQTCSLLDRIHHHILPCVCHSGVHNRAIGELAGLAVGATILLNVMFAGPISGASMNPARSLGPAIVSNKYRGLWIYIVSPIAGAVAGAWVYNIIRFTNKPLREITKSASFLIKTSSRSVG
ncbi:hypothetical protein Leryth_000197 [Lithospermum erythrorhizon]|nr:hypothetical protein Leryth_000197 [Lithospermum erythrorhizon]